MASTNSTTHPCRGPSRRWRLEVEVGCEAWSEDRAGTTFEAHDRRLSAWRLWIAFASEVRGTVVVDDGARRALTHGSRSLLPAGVRSVEGAFEAGDTVAVRDPPGEVFARGMVEAAAELRAVPGRRTSDLPNGMVHEVIHRDDLVVLPT